jgi:hypothetical protein
MSSPAGRWWSATSLDDSSTTQARPNYGSGASVKADFYVLATTPFAAADILERTPSLAAQEQLRLFRPLTQCGPPTPKWVNTTKTQPNQPTQATPVPNLVLAGAHTRTEADVWSIEGAVESGRRAARAIEPSINVLPQYVSPYLRVIRAVDNACFAIGAPHVFDLVLFASAIALVVVLALVALW